MVYFWTKGTIAGDSRTDQVKKRRAGDRRPGSCDPGGPRVGHGSSHLTSGAGTQRRRRNAALPQWRQGPCLCNEPSGPAHSAKLCRVQGWIYFCAEDKSQGIRAQTGQHITGSCLALFHQVGAVFTPLCFCAPSNLPSAG